MRLWRRREPSEQDAGDQSSVALFDVGLRRHRCQNMPDLFDGRRILLAMRCRNADFLFRQVEIFGIGVGDRRLGAGFSRQPLEEGLQGA